MKRMIFSTDQSLAPFLLRLFLALVLFPHGAQKLLGWFGGAGFNGSMDYFTEKVHLPWGIGFIVIMIEFFGPLALLLGFAVRLWSVAIAVVMAGIILTHFTDYFFMNWFGNQKTEGMEFFLLVIGMTGALIYAGAGRFSIDAVYGRTGDR
ncbi:DoxX family protein [Longitalea luteola]|uniref:DoxX family protein n=1 Tax=Longitalea luteola TaxID=2812563 RepID=UPI001F614EE6|nr:DoxX family protein [Longitalea luteola]